MVGLSEPDDAVVWRLDDERTLIVTTDFFTPVVDDAYDYGAIAAANSLSDIYAMGGKPFLALNIAALPPNLPPEISGEIMRGGAEKAKEAGVIVAGGHTIQDTEPKYGLVCENIKEVITWMKRLNRDAAILAGEFGVRAATDITGFSLLGHAWEMAAASGVGLRLAWEKIPFVGGARKYASDFSFPGGAFDNRLYFGKYVRFVNEIEEWEELLLFDPQTSGGLLLAVPSERVGAMLSRAQEMGQALWAIGEVVAGGGIEVW